jgi:Cdc6-like AAA superfamily ATPase
MDRGRSSDVERLFLTNLNPASVDPEEIVDRDGDAQWLHDGMTAWLGSRDPRPGGAFCILGDKGIGKSILTRRVIAQLREVHAATTLFVTVDCRPARSQRDIFQRAASQLLEELKGRRDVAEPLKAAVQAFAALTRFDEVTLRKAHEHLIQFKVGLDLGGSTSLFKWLDTTFGISLTRSKKLIESLEGSISVNAALLHEAFVQLIEDIHRSAKLRVVLYLDNLEELRHETIARPISVREEVRGEVEALLDLSEAPLGLIINMRTYYSSVLTRRISKRRTLGPLTRAEHLNILTRRIQRERSEVKKRVEQDPGIQASLQQLASMAHTPLAFLAWAEFVLEEGLYANSDMREALRGRLRNHYPDLVADIPKIAALFADNQATVNVEAVRDACGQSELILRKLLDQQVLLPDNYWDPSEFHLDPELGFLIGRGGSRDG